MAAVPSTKGNLMKAKKSLALAQNGYELMDRKRNILIREMMSEVAECPKCFTTHQRNRKFPMD